MQHPAERHADHRRAFSLVELSIVLVILGLLVGGILSGQALIRAAELRAVSTEASRYITAVQTFRDKYFAIPGDMANATQFWGLQISGSGCTTRTGAAVATPGACDGNGNGFIEGAGGASQAGEFAQFWRQLASAGLIEGTFSGMAGTGSISHCVIGTDCPKSKLSNAGWGAYANMIPDANTYSLDYGNLIRVAGQHATSIPAAPVFKPEEAWNIDTKMDDGKPAQGKVIALYWNNLCSTPDDGTTFTNTNLAASYKLSDSALRCGIYFRQAF